MKKVIIIVLALLLVTSGAWARGMRDVYVETGGAIGFVPEPTLVSPVTDQVDLKGKEALVFEWNPFPGDIVRRDYYDFRVYKGTNRVEDNLIYKEKIGKSTYQVSLDANRFENGQIYTWSVRQVYGGGFKSRKSYQSFKVAK